MFNAAERDVVLSRKRLVIASGHSMQKTLSFMSAEIKS